MRNRFELWCLLQYLIAEDEPLLVRAVSQAVRRIAAARGFRSINAFLDAHKLRPDYIAAMEISKGKVKDPDKFAKCISVLQIPLEELFEVDYRPAPFNEWRPGAVLVLLLGQRPVHINGVSSDHEFNVVGGRDVVAMSELTTRMLSFLRVDFRLETKTIRPESTVAEVDAILDELTKRPEVQMVLALGSPFVNIGSECIAQRIAQRAGVDDLPFKFRFSFDIRRAGIPLPSPSLLVGAQCERTAEGIETSGGKLLPRLHEGLVAADVRKGNDGPFLDCGVVLLDCSTDQYLAVCAGHGGCGTIASVLALTATSHVGAAIEKSRVEAGPLGNNRIAEYVWVHRFKPKSVGASVGSSAPVASDDLDFDREFGKGWGFQ
jgi:hypothetical protein